MWDLIEVSVVLGRDQGSSEWPLEKKATSLTLGRENAPLVGRGLVSRVWLNGSVTLSTGEALGSAPTTT